MSQPPPVPPEYKPPQTPMTLEYATPQLTGPNLKNVAKQQRAINLLILVQIVLYIGMIASNSTHVPLLTAGLALLYLAGVIAGAVFIFMLAISLYNTGVGVLLGILTLIPLIGLLTLLTVNGKATKVLRQHGIRVGLLGADPNTVPDQGGP